METTNDNFSEENFLPGIGKKNSFVLPDAYFNNLSARVTERIKFEKELEEYKTLSQINRQLKFSVPPNYFENLTNILELKFELTQYSTLEKLPKNNLSEPAVDYFETLQNNILNKIITKHNSSDPPKGILKQLNAAIFNPKMAMAASMALIIGLAAFWYVNKPASTIQSGDCKTLACLEKHELLNEKNINDFDDENLYEMVDVEELDKNVSENETVNDSIIKDKKE